MIARDSSRDGSDLPAKKSVKTWQKHAPHDSRASQYSNGYNKSSLRVKKQRDGAYQQHHKSLATFDDQTIDQRPPFPNTSPVFAPQLPNLDAANLPPSPAHDNEHAFASQESTIDEQWRALSNQQSAPVIALPSHRYEAVGYSPSMASNHSGQEPFPAYLELTDPGYQAVPNPSSGFYTGSQQPMSASSTHGSGHFPYKTPKHSAKNSQASTIIAEASKVKKPHKLNPLATEFISPTQSQKDSSSPHSSPRILPPWSPELPPQLSTSYPQSIPGSMEKRPVKKLENIPHLPPFVQAEASCPSSHTLSAGSEDEKIKRGTTSETMMLGEAFKPIKHNINVSAEDAKEAASSESRQLVSDPKSHEPDATGIANDHKEAISRDSAAPWSKKKNDFNRHNVKDGSKIAQSYESDFPPIEAAVQHQGERSPAVTPSYAKIEETRQRNAAEQKKLQDNEQMHLEKKDGYKGKHKSSTTKQGGESSKPASGPSAAAAKHQPLIGPKETDQVQSVGGRPPKPKGKKKKSTAATDKDSNTSNLVPPSTSTSEASKEQKADSKADLTSATPTGPSHKKKRNKKKPAPLSGLSSPNPLGRKDELKSAGLKTPSITLPTLSSTTDLNVSSLNTKGLVPAQQPRAPAWVEGSPASIREPPASAGALRSPPANAPAGARASAPATPAPAGDERSVSAYREEMPEKEMRKGG